MLPTFLIIGAMKAGTTSLWVYLRQHPDVFVAEQKEVNFFIGRRRWEAGPEWYASLFAGGGNAKARGEASPAYTMIPLFEDVPQRIAAIVPDVRLIYLVRDPIERIRSHWQHSVMTGRERRSAEVALREERLYVEVSRYAAQLDAYLGCFPREQILVITAEALRDDRTASLRRVYEFIEVDPDWTAPSIDLEHHITAELTPRAPLRRWLASRGKLRAARKVTPAWLRAWYTRAATRSLPDGTISAELEKELREALSPDVERLRPFVSGPFDGWRMLSSKAP